MKKREPYKGQDFSKCEILTVPDAAMSLQEMIERFTRNESVDLGFPVNYHESEDDIEKLRLLDPVEKREYIERMKQVQKDFEAEQERLKLELEEKTRQDFIKSVEKKTRMEMRKSAKSGGNSKV